MFAMWKYLKNDIQVNLTPKNLWLGGYKDEDGKNVQVLSFKLFQNLGTTSISVVLIN